MMLSKINVLPALALTASGLSLSTPVAAQESRQARLLTLPQTVYLTTSNAREGIDASIFFLFVETEPNHEIAPEELILDYRDGASIVYSERLSASYLQSIDAENLSPTRVDGSEPEPPVFWPHGYRLHIALPVGIDVDSVSARLTISETDGSDRIISSTFALPHYDQHADLIFPFRGEGIISVGGALASGHRNRSGLYAVDALGLSPTYGPMNNAETYENATSHAGWGRSVIAPAAGMIVVARNDRPDQPVAGNSDPTYYAPEYPDGGDPGNFVVIDHGNGEFSMIAHMQHGSVRVAVGDQVLQGQQLGQLGNSGDTTGPHVHYQLQNGPDWNYSDALPFAFSNMRTLTRGTYFKAE